MLVMAKKEAPRNARPALINPLIIANYPAKTNKITEDTALPFGHGRDQNDFSRLRKLRDGTESEQQGHWPLPARPASGRCIPYLIKGYITEVTEVKNGA